MPRYKFTYRQLHSAYMDATFGALEPQRMLVGPDTHRQLGEWLAGQNWDHLHPDGKGYWFQAASILPDESVPEGEVHYIGGNPDVLVITLEKADDD